MWEGVIVGMAVGGVNGGVAWLLLRWAADKDMMSFLKAVLGGMVARLFFVAIASFLVIMLTSVDRVAYFIGLMGVYLLSLAVEVVLVVGRARPGKRVEAEDRRTCGNC